MRVKVTAFDDFGEELASFSFANNERADFLLDEKIVVVAWNKLLAGLEALSMTVEIAKIVVEQPLTKSKKTFDFNKGTGNVDFFIES